MFQTEPIVFLQSRGGALLDGLMTGVSTLGYPAFYVIVLSVLIFAVDFRRGFVLLQILLWTGALTEVLKHALALPRPYDVDSRVLDVTRGRTTRTELFDMGGHGFFGLPQEEALRYVRSHGDWKYGLPSGHTSGCTAFTGGWALLWNSRRGAIAACGAIFAMAFSRVYLGRHFLADVLGGVALGATVLACAAWWLSRPGAALRLPAAPALPRSLGVALALLVPPIGLLALPIPADAVGLLFGINLGFLLVGRGGYPADAGSPWQRTARALLALAITAAAGALVRLLASRLGEYRDQRIIDFALGTIPGFALLWGTTTVTLRAGLYRKRRD